MKEFIHLFTDVKERLPENKTQGFAYRHDRVLAGLFMMYSNTPAIDCGGGNIEYYTHWLDLSTLTTKKIKQQDKDDFFEDWKNCIPAEISRDGSYDDISCTFEVMDGIEEFKKAIDRL